MAAPISIDIHGDEDVLCDGCGRPIEDNKIVDIEDAIGYVVVTAWLFPIRFGNLVTHEREACKAQIAGRP